MTAEKSRRFALTGQDAEGRNRTIIVWREADLVDGHMVRRVVLTLDATMSTATVLTCSEAVEWRRRSWRLPDDGELRHLGTAMRRFPSSASRTNFHEAMHATFLTVGAYESPAVERRGNQMTRSTPEDYEWMRVAIALAHQCPSSPDAYSVGAVIVDRDGKEISRGYSRETDSHVHADESALAKLAQDDPRLKTATIYSTLEPCSQRHLIPTGRSN